MLKTIQGSTGNSLPSYNVPEPLTGIVTDGNKVWVAAKNPYAQAKTNIYSFNVDGAARKDSIYGISSANIKDMAIDPSIKTIYVADGNNLGKFNYGADGAITDQANFFVAGINPSGIAIDDLGNIFAVSNAATANIVPIIKYGKTGIEVLRFTTKGKNQAGPTVSAVGDIAYDPNLGGIIYVLARLTTTGNMAILRFDSQGNFIRYFGEEASMQDPVGIALGSDGSLFVTDNAANGIFQFAPAK